MLADMLWLKNGLLIGTGLWLLAALLLDLSGHRPVPAGTWDAVIVAGCRVMPDGQPSPSLQRRTELAVLLWKAGKAEQIVFTGGLGTYPPSEAIAAATHAQKLGVPVSAMILEDSSTSTEENAKLAAQALEARDYKDARVLVVSDSYHILRAERVFARYFAEARGVGATPQPWPRARGAMREVAALSWYAIRGRL